MSTQSGSLRHPAIPGSRALDQNENLIKNSGLGQEGEVDLRPERRKPPKRAFEPFVQCREAASFLGLHRKTVERYARQGVIPAHPATGRRRKRWRFLISELDVWLRSKVISGCHPCSPEQ
jgi:excisionase family DNA binding protein